MAKYLAELDILYRFVTLQGVYVVNKEGLRTRWIKRLQKCNAILKRKTSELSDLVLDRGNILSRGGYGEKCNVLPGLLGERLQSLPDEVRKIRIGMFILSILYLCTVNLYAQRDSVYCTWEEIDYADLKQFSNDSIYRYALCLYRNGNTARSKAYLRKLNNRDSIYRASRDLLASIYRNEHNYHAAADMYVALIKIDSSQGSYYRSYGDMLMKMGLVSGAEMAYRKAIMLNGSDIRSHLKLSEIFLSRGDDVSAKPHIEKILSMDESHLRALQLAQKIALLEGSWKDVIALKNRIASIAQSSVGVMTRAAYAYMKLDSTRKAIGILDNLTDLENPETIYLYLAMCYSELDDSERAESYYRKSIEETIPTSLPYRIKLYGRYLEREGKYAEAYEAYKRAYKLKEDSEILFALGRVCEYAFADKMMAMRYYREYIEEGGKNHIDKARERLAYLKKYHKKLKAYRIK